jgi:hypothetical protein
MIHASSCCHSFFEFVLDTLDSIYLDSTNFSLQGTGPLSDALLVRELSAFRVLRTKRATLERQMSDFDVRLRQAHFATRKMEL